MAGDQTNVSRGAASEQKPREYTAGMIKAIVRERLRLSDKKDPHRVRFFHDDGSEGFIMVHDIGAFECSDDTPLPHQSNPYNCIFKKVQWNGDIRRTVVYSCPKDDELVLGDALEHMVATGNAHKVAFRAFLLDYTYLDWVSFLVRNDSAILSTIDKAKNMIRLRKYVTLDDACLRIGDRRKPELGFGILIGLLNSLHQDNIQQQNINCEQQNSTRQSNDALFAAMTNGFDALAKLMAFQRESHDKVFAFQRESHDKNFALLLQNVVAQREASQQNERRLYNLVRAHLEPFTVVPPSPPLGSVRVQMLPLIPTALHEM